MIKRKKRQKRRWGADEGGRSIYMYKPAKESTWKVAVGRRRMFLGDSLRASNTWMAAGVLEIT